MKTEKIYFKKIIITACNFLIAISPLLVSKTACFFSWGEPEYPEILKNETKKT